MATKSVNSNRLATPQPNAKKLVNIMTIIAWIALGIGVLLCLINLGHFSDQNVGLMVGIGFLVGSVHIYVIGTAIGLVHTRAAHLSKSNRQPS